MGEALRKVDASVKAMFVDAPESHLAMEAELEKRESDVLQAAKMDFSFRTRSGDRRAVGSRRTPRTIVA